jgi:putative oxidoreductase
MRIAGIIARVLLGLMFTVFGLNGFLHFIPMKSGPMSPLAMQYMGSVAQSGMLQAAFALQLITGLMLLANVFVPLALVLLGAELGNILLFHATMAPKGIINALVALLLWLVVFAGVRSSFAPLFRPRV